MSEPVVEEIPVVISTQICPACRHSRRHDVPGYIGCTADVMYEGRLPGDKPYWLQCCCDGTSGPRVLR